MQLSTETGPLSMIETGETGRQIRLRFFFKTGRYEVREQYYVYDQDSFIVDVGGYLGLLLGHSIYSSVVFSVHGITGLIRPK